MKAKKKVFVVAVAVCLIAILSMSSLAWFSDQDEVTNEFMISTSDDVDDPDGIFSVDIWELVPDGDDADDDPDKISVGASVVQTLKLMRCTEAQRLIEGGMSVSAAAAACGFENLSYFSRSFKGLFGHLPSKLH